MSPGKEDMRPCLDLMLPFQKAKMKYNIIYIVILLLLLRLLSKCLTTTITIKSTGLLLLLLSSILQYLSTATSIYITSATIPILWLQSFNIYCMPKCSILKRTHES